MKHVLLFNTRTAFIVLLLGNSALPLYALPPVTVHKNSSHQAEEGIIENIAELLEAQGLEKSVALEKTKRLFSRQYQNIEIKLHHLQTHPDLLLSAEKINRTLARRALFEKSLNLDSYASLVGFIQEVKGHPLEQNALKAIEQITTLSRTLS